MTVRLDCVVPVFWWCFFFFFFNSPIHFSSWPPARINRKAFWKGIGSYHHNQLKATVSPVVMYGSENWTIKKAEHQRIDVFELCCWRRLLRVPWTIRRSNQSSIKEISPEYSLEALTLKLKLQYFGHLMQRTDSLERL